METIKDTHKPPGHHTITYHTHTHKKVIVSLHHYKTIIISAIIIMQKMIKIVICGGSHLQSLYLRVDPGKRNGATLSYMVTLSLKTDKTKVKNKLVFGLVNKIE